MHVSFPPRFDLSTIIIADGGVHFYMKTAFRYGQLNAEYSNPSLLLSFQRIHAILYPQILPKSRIMVVFKKMKAKVLGGFFCAMYAIGKQK
jgi:hypothetical protein